MNILKSRVVKVLREIDEEVEGITPDELGKKLYEKHADSLSFSNFDEFIQLNLLTGRLELRDKKLYITERGRKVIEAY